MRPVVWIILGIAALVAIHNLALWAERRGWIYYKYRKASPGTSASAFLEVQSLLQPGTKHVVESRLETHAAEDDSGDPPPDQDSGGPARPRD